MLLSMRHSVSWLLGGCLWDVAQSAERRRTGPASTGSMGEDQEERWWRKWQGFHYLNRGIRQRRHSEKETWGLKYGSRALIGRSFGAARGWGLSCTIAQP